MKIVLSSMFFFVLLEGNPFIPGNLVKKINMAMQKEDIIFLKEILEQKLIHVDDKMALERSYAHGLCLGTMLHRALELGKNEIARFLIEQGADVNALDQTQVEPFYMRTPLITALQLKNFEMAKYLVERGAHIEMKPPSIHGKQAHIISVNEIVRDTENNEILESILPKTGTTAAQESS